MPSRRMPQRHPQPFLRPSPTPGHPTTDVRFLYALHSTLYPLHLESPMNYRSLGRSGLKVPELCFGTGTFGGRQRILQSLGHHPGRRSRPPHRHLHGSRLQLLRHRRHLLRRPQRRRPRQSHRPPQARRRPHLHQGHLPLRPRPQRRRQLPLPPHRRPSSSPSSASTPTTSTSTTSTPSTRPPPSKRPSTPSTRWSAKARSATSPAPTSPAGTS